MMKPAQRIEIIRSIVAATRDIEWPDLDLILRQFGFPWSNNWNGDKDDYVIAHVEGQSDEKLLELHQYFLGSGDEDEEIEVVAGPWRPQRFRLFVSYYHTFGVEAAALAQALEDFGISAYVAHDDIHPTDEWREEIQNALLTCDALLVCLTTDVRESEWVDQEIGMSLGRRKLVIPLNVGANPHGFIERFQALKGDGLDASQRAREIFEILLNNHLTMSAMVSGLVGRIEESDSFETSNRVGEYLNLVPTWSTDQLQRLDNALNANRQISESYYAKPIIEQLLREQSS
jgi:hypothetical protein